ncbi:hypothetical protein ElyMa_006556000 [Elysia marginata]|uniref:Uncharacterized protein n=1 Tax=Elysia marginata TaxID=1093978 RepID=A0AAV4I8X3_9GAST|nr:hypothetical protein ElyMa_006556000 [Elysia marginata]
MLCPRHGVPVPCIELLLSLPSTQGWGCGSCQVYEPAFKLRGHLSPTTLRFGRGLHLGRGNPLNFQGCVNNCIEAGESPKYIRLRHQFFQCVVLNDFDTDRIMLI